MIRLLLLMCFLAVLVSCTTAPKKTIVPKYKAGDCVSISVQHVDENMNWDSSGQELAYFRIKSISNSQKPYEYMAERMRADLVYVIEYKFYPEELVNNKRNQYSNGRTFIIPVEDLDGLRYSGQSWPYKDEHGFNCNRYDKKD